MKIKKYKSIWLNCTLFIFDQSSGCMKVCIFSFNLRKKILVLKYRVKKKHANTCLTQSRHAINRLLLKLFCSLQFAFETNEELANSGSLWCYIFKIFLGLFPPLSYLAPGPQQNSALDPLESQSAVQDPSFAYYLVHIVFASQSLQCFLRLSFLIGI